MTEFILRDILKDWMTTMGITLAERADAATKKRSEVTGGEAAYDLYDRAMTYIEKRIGQTIPATIVAFDLLFELGAKLWLCARVLAREIPNIDISQRKNSLIYRNVQAENERLNKEFAEIRKEIWGEGQRHSRTTTGDLSFAVMSAASAKDADIANGDVLEL